eukprot:13703870-Ditylum_brightwellii.AAC.1
MNKIARNSRITRVTRVTKFTRITHKDHQRWRQYYYKRRQSNRGSNDGVTEAVLLEKAASFLSLLSGNTEAMEAEVALFPAE